MLRSLVVLFILVTPVYSIDDLRPENCVKNKAGGVCFWCCAEMIGKEMGITPLTNITDQVIATGIGHKTGATLSSIKHWISTLHLKAISTSRTGEVEKLLQLLDAGLPVIITVKDWEGSDEKHAVLGLKSYFKEKIEHGKKVRYRVVRIVDPNTPACPRNVRWSWLSKYWTGRSYAFDPKDQDPRLVRNGSFVAPPVVVHQPQPNIQTPTQGPRPATVARQSLPPAQPINPGRLMLVDVLRKTVYPFTPSYAPTPIPAKRGNTSGECAGDAEEGDKQYGSRPQLLLPPRTSPELIITVPAADLNSLLYQQQVVKKIPTNQDIKDGVHRPLDNDPNYLSYLQSNLPVQKKKK